MDVRSCKQCGTLFNFQSGLPLCPACIGEIDKQFPEVKQFIYDNPGADMAKVSEKFSIPTPVIKRWVREERLSFVAGSGIALSCERCGKDILSGRFCDSCKSAMTKELGSVYRAPAPAKQGKEKTSAKMRFLDNTKNG